jgi:hypothetical protein
MHRLVARLGSAALLLAASCSSYTVATPQTPPVDPRAAVPPDAAEICVLHLPSTAPASTPVTQIVHDNGRLAGATVGAGYFCYPVRPGPHRVTSEVGIYAETLDLVLAPGERRFVQQAYLDREGVSIAPMPEPDARVALPRLPFQQLVSAPEPVPSPSAVAAEAPLPDVPPEPPRRRPFGMVFGAAGGLGLASARTSPATRATGGFAALGSFDVGLPVTDLALLALRLDAAFLNGTTIADLTLHLAVFPGAARPGPVSDLMIFADGGARIPTSGTMASGVTGVARIGVGWERWNVKSAVVGPFLCGQVARGGGEADAAVLAGVGASLYPAGARR